MTTEMVSCDRYEEGFLKTEGYSDKENCVDLNLALQRQYLDDCSSNLKTTGKESYDRELMDKCVYHRFAINEIFLASQYFLYKTSNAK